MNVNIHIGIHKTATTFLQTHLAGKAGALANEGTLFIPLMQLRKGVTRRIGKIAGLQDPAQRPAAVAALTAEIDALVAQATRTAPPATLLLSEENFIGGMNSLSTSGTLYPHLAERLAILEEALAGHHITYLMALRDYPSYLISAYCELLRHRKLPPLPQFIAKVMANKPSWLEVIDRLAARFPGRRILFWRYEEFRDNAGDVLQALTNLPLSMPPAAMESPVRVSLPAKGVRVLQAASKFLTLQEHTRLASYLAEKFDYEDDGGKLDFPDAALKTELRQRYEAEWQALLGRSKQAIGIVRQLD